MKEGGKILRGGFDSGVWVVSQPLYRRAPCLLGGVLGRITKNILRMKIKN